MERHRKYREEIRHKPDSAFARYKTSSIPMSSANHALMEQAEAPQKAISYGELMESAKKKPDPFYENNPRPYQAYLNRKRNRLIAKFVLLAIALIGMAVWFILLQGRR